MKTFKPTALALSLVAAFAATGAQAQSNEALVKEVKALRERMEQLEKKLAEQQQAPKPAEPKWGMTPEQAQEFNRIAVKTEAIEDSLETLGHKNLKITGFADPTFIYNQKRHRAGFQFLNPVGDDGYNYDNSYFGVVSLDLLKEMEGGTKWHLTLVPNRGTLAVTNGDNSIVQEASVLVPLGDLNHRLIAGHVPDWSGYEYQPATQNKLISHNLLFDFTLPTSYTGIGYEMVDGKWLVKGMLANVNATKLPDGRTAPALVGRIDYSKGEFNGWGAAGLVGKMPNYVTGTDSMTHLLEVDGYFIRGDWTVQGQVSYGKQAKAANDGSGNAAEWYGLSTLAAYKFIPRWEATARFDYLYNRKNGGGLLGYTGYVDDQGNPAGDYRNGIGIAPGGDASRGTNRMALSLGLSYLYNLNTTFKLEGRFDRADQAIFEDFSSGNFGKNNFMLGTAMVVAF